MDRLYLIYAACGSLAVVLALVSREMHRLPLSPDPPRVIRFR